MPGLRSRGHPAAEPIDRSALHGDQVSPMKQDGRLFQILMGETRSEYHMIVKWQVTAFAHQRPGRFHRSRSLAGRGWLRAMPISAALVAPAHTDVFDGCSPNL